MFPESIRHRRYSKGCLAKSWTNPGGWRCSEIWQVWEAFWSEGKMKDKAKYLLDSEDNFRLGCRNVRYQQHFFPELIRSLHEDKLYKNVQYFNSSHESKAQMENDLSALLSDKKQGVCYIYGMKGRKIEHSRKSELVRNNTFVSCHNLRVQGTSCLASSCITLVKPRSGQKWPAAITPWRKKTQNIRTYREFHIMLFPNTWNT